MLVIWCKTSVCPGTHDVTGNLNACNLNAGNLNSELQSISRVIQHLFVSIMSRDVKLSTELLHYVRATAKIYRNGMSSSFGN